MSNVMIDIVFDAVGTKMYYNSYGFRHREDGPAMISKDGSKYWYLNGIQHSDKFPSDRYRNGIVAWCFEHKWHRENGPAGERPNGYKIWVKDNNRSWPELK